MAKDQKTASTADRDSKGGSAVKPGAGSPGRAAAKKDAASSREDGKGRKPAPKKAQEKGPGTYEKIKQFFREVRVELKKVTWPSRKETLASTSVILVLVFIIALYLGVVDAALAWALNHILR